MYYIKKALKRVGRTMVRAFMLILRVFPIKQNKIVFSSFGSRNYSDNPRAILEKMIELKLEYDYVYVLRNIRNNDLPKCVRPIKYLSLSYLYEMATAKLWIDNTRKHDIILKRKGQKYIQTWHGTIGFKKIEADLPNIPDVYLKTAINDSKNIDLLLCGSEWSKKMLASCFFYQGEIAITGTPRNDILFKENEDIKESLRMLLKISSNDIVVLYAPTFRNSGDTSVYNIDYVGLKECLHSKFGKNVRILVKLHPNIMEHKIELPSWVDNVTRFNDINHLFLISDMLITDYSSCAFDFMLTNKPIFIYAPDLQSYMNDRDFHFKLTDTPFVLSKSNDELLSKITEYDQQNYNNSLNEFITRLQLREDGCACERVVAIIKNIIEN